MRNGKTLLHRVSISIAVIAAIFGAAGMSWAADKGGAGIVRLADVILIDAVAGFRKLENSKVAFRHDMHTQALAAQGKDCSACHKTVEGGRMSTKFMRLEDKDADSLKLVYHTNCVSCHTAVKKAAKAGQKSGPLEGECKRCHDTDGRYASARQSFSYGATMHNKHVRSLLIKDGSSPQNCAACHHSAASGKEDSCRVCHAQGHGIRPWYSEVGHNFCISCHKNVSMQAKNAPLECAGCHSAEAKAAQAVTKDVPRLMRGQPDTTLVFPASTGITPAAAMNPALFDHKTHEGKIGSCRSCHHVRIGTCTSCHTAEGTQAGYNVTLDKAMHDETSQRSCIGCHNKRIQAPECAGCHGFVKPARGKDFCNICHADAAGLDKKSFAAGIAGVLPKADKVQLAEAAKNAETPVKALNLDNVPEGVSISALKDEYDANEFSHKTHVESYLMDMVKGDKLASAFHTDPATLCVGCHHNSPPSMNPPKCSSCHGKTIDMRSSERPTLKAAYHLLCMGCHERMKVEPAAKTDCTACHTQAKK